MDSQMRRLLTLFSLALCVGSCSPAPRDIRVVWQDGLLVVDFPWSFWRLIGLQNRSFCITEAALFDQAESLWRIKMNDNPASCLDVHMPIILGRAPRGFVEEGVPRLERGVQYGFGIYGSEDGRVDFVVTGQSNEIRNITDYKDMIQPSCGFGDRCWDE